MDRSTYGTGSIEISPAVVQDLPTRILLNGYIVRDAEVQKRVTVDGAASVADNDTQHAAD